MGEGRAAAAAARAAAEGKGPNSWRWIGGVWLSGSANGVQQDRVGEGNYRLR